ncbi:hypothetical protein LWI29_004455 [Acer saccharum]|uniref:CASP-like protein n=1 Tax=Acer saccharum TaxID=4024 RepID=A0AA39RG56_ACESA|nr:hypothetical protein LWI29_004455 [Acer saccharum]
MKVIDRRIRVVELVLRCVICGLGVLAAVLVGTDTQVREIFTIQKKAIFTDMKALVFLVIANGIVAAYSLVQGVRCVVGMIRGSVLFNKPLAWAIFSGDQLLYRRLIESPNEAGFASPSSLHIRHHLHRRLLIESSNLCSTSRNSPQRSQLRFAVVAAHPPPPPPLHIRLC